MLYHKKYPYRDGRHTMETKNRRDMPEELISWKTAYNRFNRWSENGLWQNFFLAFDQKLIQSGYSSMEVTYGVINMQVELGLVKLEQLDKVTVGEVQKSIYVVMPMDIRSILKSLGVKSTTVKLHQS